jgi:upstream activation factor subunit UAF30
MERLSRTGWLVVTLHGRRRGRAAPITTASLEDHMATKPAAKPKKAPAGGGDNEDKKGVAKGKKVAKPAAGNKPNALQQPLQPSEQLAEVVGSAPLARGEVVSKVWEYIKSKNLQNPQDKREILADEKLKKVFGKDRVTMFEMNKHLAAHLK